MNELALFAGAGGGILGGRLLGWRTVCAVEWDGYARDVLVARQNDGSLEPFPVWDDVQTFDGRPWRGRVDVVSGGFPCQDISAAGKGAGIDGERSGMWVEMARIIGEVRPRFAFVENSPMLTSRGLGRVLGDLAALGYDARWGVVGAHHAGAPHKRDRIWIVGADAGLSESSQRETQADAGAGTKGRDAARDEPTPFCGDVPHAHGRGQQERVQCDGEPALADDPQRGRGTGRSRGSDPSCAGQHEQALQDVADSTDDGAGRWQQQPKGGEGARDVADAVRERGAAGAADPARREKGVAGKPDDGSADVGDAPGFGGRPGLREEGQIRDGREPANAGWWTAEPDVGRVAHGVAARVDRLRCLGNGQVPAVAALAWRLLAGCDEERGA